MKSRSSTIAIALAFTLVIFFTNAVRPFNNVLDVFCWLGYLLVLTTLLIWPRTGKYNQQERRPRSNWADKVRFDS